MEEDVLCPTCGNELVPIAIEEIELDVCKDGCGGIWFDRFELQKLDEQHEFSDAHLEDVLCVESPATFDGSVKRGCPKCDGITMMQHFFSVKREVEVDHCPKCAGYWLDEGELFRIRQQFATEAERKRAATEHFSSLFDGELAALRKETEEETQKAKNIYNMFRLILPSYYFGKAG